jgi:trans-2,3-dihydro-3-hydroxyanthranilate isomerase
MKYTYHIVDVFSSTPFGGNQLAVLPDAAGISTEGMQKIAREFNFGETTFVLPKNDPNTYRVRTRAGRQRRSRDGQRLCRPRRGHGIES